MSKEKKQPTILGFFSKVAARNAPTKAKLISDVENSSPLRSDAVSPSQIHTPPSSRPELVKRDSSQVGPDSDDDDEGPLRPVNGNRGRALKRRKIAAPDSDDEFQIDEDVESAMVDAAMAEDEDLDLPSERTSTAAQWKFDPENIEPAKARPAATQQSSSGQKKKKEKAHTREPEERYVWLANLRDADKNAPGHPDYDPRTVYIPPLAWNNFSPFEKQYWEIKQKFWDTLVFFKKGKFYELYENDATIGHQLFDLKLTDRVNMRMVGVPEASLEYWANQFVAKGYKIARVDQMETALGKEMRERGDGAKKKEEKVIRRELASVLTSGTLVDGNMLQDDMSTYCVAIKASQHTQLYILSFLTRSRRLIGTGYRSLESLSSTQPRRSSR